MANVISPNATIRRPASFPYCGRLIALPTGNQLKPDETLDLTRAISIDFPAMPDSVELARSAEYSVTSPINMADGIHYYKGVRPLDIPFSFRLHAFDKDFCPNGVYTMLQLAGRLHALALPIETGENVPVTMPVNTTNDDGAQEARAQGTSGVPSETSVANTVAPPVTCQLQLIYAGNNAPGIMCLGYVREVSVKLNGPWLLGPNGSFNLPSSADFSFVFVHRPGHGNAFIGDTGNRLAQAYAQTVKEKFYNTRGLAPVSNYRGLQAISDVSAPAAPGAATQNVLFSP